MASQIPVTYPGQLPRGSASTEDQIRVKNLQLTAAFTDGAQWPASSPNKPKLQPIEVTLSLSHSIYVAAAGDDLQHSINYSTVCALATDASRSRNFVSTEDLVDTIQTQCSTQLPNVQEISVAVARPKALLQPATVKFTSSKARGSETLRQELSIYGMECHPIVGINACERVQKQLVRFDLSIYRTVLVGQQGIYPFRDLYMKISNEVNASEYLTLEALVSRVADLVLVMSGQVEHVTVRGGKPNALACAEAAEVEIRRDPTTLFQRAPIALTDISQVSCENTHRVAIALGSNLGDRFANIELALRLLEAPSSQYGQASEKQYVSVVDTSFLYETDPMYVTDQPKFINCACMIETNIAPFELLKFFKEIERTVGRVTSFRNGPRAIDLDVLTYDNLVIDTRPINERANLDNLIGHLLVPHPRIAEREFVLRPLNDIIPDFIHPVLKHTIREIFTSLVAAQPTNTPVMHKVTPFPSYPQTTPLEKVPDNPTIPTVPSTAAYWTFPVSRVSASHNSPQRPYLMATLNVTPDSFSDGSDNSTIPAALQYATDAVQNGADIIDIGGYSTRPGAPHVSPEDELGRVVPFVQAIRGLMKDSHNGSSATAKRQVSRALTSVDTFRWEVAEEAIEAGANCINDVYAFTGPVYPVDQAGWEHLQKMRRVARDRSVPVILMHSRGEASANKDYSQYAYAADGSGRGMVIEGVKAELSQKVERIVKGKGGLRRWFVILDPGIGFSKAVEGNIEVLRRCSEITESGSMLHGRPNPLVGYPMLIGASRKSFLGNILSKPDPTGTYNGRETQPKEREFATAAAVACAVQQGAAAVRVHDVQAMGDVIRVASAIWR